MYVQYYVTLRKMEEKKRKREHSLASASAHTSSSSTSLAQHVRDSEVFFVEDLTKDVNVKRGNDVQRCDSQSWVVTLTYILHILHMIS